MAAPIVTADSVCPEIGKGFGLQYSEEWMMQLAKLAEQPDGVERLTKFKAMQEEDPLMYGWAFPGWTRPLECWKSSQVMVLLGGNRASKSTLCARLAIWVALNIPGARVRCWSANEETSVNDQQRVIWQELPSRYKNLPAKRRAPYSVEYTQKNGFTGNKLILPPIEPGYEGGEIIFQTYKSWSNDDKVAEGWWAHFIWCDEECPPKLFETLRYRLGDANGRLFLSFTSINGWTALIASLLNKAKALVKRYAPLVKRELPVERNVVPDGSVKVFNLWTQDNIFLQPDFRAGKHLQGKPESDILSRHYGEPTRARACAFAGFNRDVHVVKHDEIPFIKNPKYEVTRYHGIDPAGRKPWFILWGAYDAADCLWIYKEWPDVPAFGEWLDASGEEGGKAGPAQQPTENWGTQDYKRLLFDGKEQADSGVYESAIDPRYSASQTQGDDGAETILSKMERFNVTLIPSPGDRVEEGEQLIVDRLRYDKTKPVGVDNRPMLMISDRCENLIACMESYTGKGGKDEPSKDPIDCLRYMIQTAAGFVDPKAPVVSGGGSY